MQTENTADRSGEIEKIDLLHLLRSVLKHLKYTWYLGLVLMVACGGLGVVRTMHSYTPSYKAHASFVVNAASKDSTAANYTNTQTTKQLNETFPYIMSSGALGSIVASELGYETLPAQVTADAVGDTNLFRITVTGEDPEVIMNVLNSLIDNYPSVAEYVLGSTTLDLVNISSTPTVPWNTPDYPRTAAKYALVGLALYLILLVARSMMSRTVYSKKMLHKYISIPNMGSIPRVNMSRLRRNKPIRIETDGVSSQYRESLEAVRIRIQRTMEKNNWKAIYVTSSIAGEGKTTVTCNLAYLMAQHGLKVLLVDADLRNPSVNRNMALGREKGAPGTLEYLRGKVNLEDVLITDKIPNLTILPGGKAITKISDQFHTGKFKKLLDEYREKVDVILVDTPPCAVLDDTSMIAEFLDGGYLVVHQDYTTIDAVIAGNEIMSKTKAPLFGCSMNFVENLKVKRYR